MELADATLQQPLESLWNGGASPYKVGSKKLGMWLFILSDALTFSALIISYSYIRVSTPNWPQPFHLWPSVTVASIMTFFLLSSSITMVLAVHAAQHGQRAKAARWIGATMVGGLAFLVLHANEWRLLIEEGLRPFENPWGAGMFGGTFFTLTGMHMLHVTIGVIYLGVVALRKKFLPLLVVIWLAGWLLTSGNEVFHIGVHVLLIGAIVSAMILYLHPKDYVALDIE